MKTYHRWEDHYGKIHACTGDYVHADQYLVWSDCGIQVPAHRSEKIEDSTVTCPNCLALWVEWRGGVNPFNDYQPVQMWWANGIQRIYERSDWINWKNLPTDGSVRWRKPL